MTISRRAFLTRFLPSLAPLAMEQPSPQPQSPIEADLPDEQFKLMTAVILDVLIQAQSHHEKRLRRLEWLSPGPDLYTNKKGNT